MNRIYSITRISTSAPLYQFLTEKKHFVSAIFLNLRKYKKLSAQACIIKMRPALRSAIKSTISFKIGLIINFIDLFFEYNSLSCVPLNLIFLIT